MKIHKPKSKQSNLGVNQTPAALRMRIYRQKMRADGMRQMQIWVPANFNRKLMHEFSQALIAETLLFIKQIEKIDSTNPDLAEHFTVWCANVHKSFLEKRTAEYFLKQHLGNSNDTN